MSFSQNPQQALFHKLFVEDIPLIDTRSPGEFSKGSFPCAQNLPLMTNTERELVGTCYKQQGQQQAIELGYQLVKNEIKAQRVEAWCSFAHQHPQGYLFCWRGGLRSQISQQWMRDIGVDYPKVPGGYKALRRYLIDQSIAIAEQTKFIIIAGKTGSGKTRVLQQIPSHIDLEGLANHRGSAFGRRPSGQPSQIDFENSLAVALIKNRVEHRGAIFIEDESGFIGSCNLPLEFHRRMKQSQRVILEVPLQKRISTILHDYVISLYQEYQSHSNGNPFEAFASNLQDAFSRIRKRLGNQLYAQLSQQLQQALKKMQKDGDCELHRGWIETLLTQYYDPMYVYQLSKAGQQVVFTGNKEEILDWGHAQQMS